MVSLAVISAVAVFAFLWTLAVVLRFEHGVANLRVEVERLKDIRQQRLARLRGEEIVGVTIIDEDEDEDEEAAMPAMNPPTPAPAPPGPGAAPATELTPDDELTPQRQAA